jgi:hypothetical protein
LEFLVGGFYEIPFGYWGNIAGDLNGLAWNAQLIRRAEASVGLHEPRGTQFRASGSAVKWSQNWVARDDEPTGP